MRKTVGPYDPPVQLIGVAVRLGLVDTPDYWRCSCTPVRGLIGLMHTGPRCYAAVGCLLCDGHAGPCDVQKYD